ESASDGVIAPLFFLSLGGPPAALAYKAINTLDSLVGHLDPKYRHLGWASARLDDAANWIPARLTALLLVVAAGLTTRRVAPMRRAWRVLRRDGHKHPSPNCGRPESAMAGALGVQLGGRNVYDGVPEDRPLLGDAGEPLARAHLHHALTLMWLASGLGILLAVSWLAR
ncbi:MAG: adenosylcobinamide-phosphate synthase, partial [Nitrospirae bacterium]